MTLATAVNHRTAHRGDTKLFWDRKNWAPAASRTMTAIYSRRKGPASQLRSAATDGLGIQCIYGTEMKTMVDLPQSISILALAGTSLVTSMTFLRCPA